MTINLPIISDYDYFGELVDFIIDQKLEVSSFARFISNYDISFDCYRCSYDINNLYKINEHKITNAKNIKNSDLFVFEEGNSAIIRIFHKVLLNCSLEMGSFFSRIVMCAKGRNPQDVKKIDYIKNCIFNDKIVHFWIKQNQITLHRQIIHDECHKAY